MTHELQAGPRPLSAPVRWLLLGLAGLSLVLAAIGILVPVLPTVPFLLLAAWAAARSSPALHRWLHEHPRFGHYLRDWDQAGVVPRRAKWFATAMMAISAASLLLLLPRGGKLLALVLVAAMLPLLVWLWRRPERRPDAA
jgi:uncharacterized membrane protein YbaN (DUF454 family)